MSAALILLLVGCALALYCAWMSRDYARTAHTNAVSARESAIEAAKAAGRAELAARNAQQSLNDIRRWSA